MALQGDLFKCSQCVTTDNVYVVNAMTCIYYPDSLTYIRLEKCSSYFCFHLMCCFFIWKDPRYRLVIAPSLGMFIPSEVINGQFITGLVWEPAINTGTKVWFRRPFWFLSVCTDNDNTKPLISEYYVVTSSLFTRGHCPSSVSPTNQLVT